MQLFEKNICYLDSGLSVKDGYVFQYGYIQFFLSFSTVSKYVSDVDANGCTNF